MRGVALQVLLIALAPWALAAQVASANPCLDAELESSLCSEHLDDIADNGRALLVVGRKLEIAGRYDDAVAVYRRGLTRFRSDRDLQQSLIRARGELRARAMFSDLTQSSPGRESDCWRLTRLAAVSACAAEVEHDVDNWRLIERYGDVLRSVGRPQAALRVYRQSLDANADNPGLRRKHQTLTTLVDLDKADMQVAAQPVATQPGKRNAPIRAGRYRALVIANERYQHFERLETPVADARAIGRLLENEYGFDVTTIVNASRYQVFDALGELRRESSQYDHVLIYYAGHGQVDGVTRRGYWLPVDAEPDNSANWISTGDITNLVAGLESQHALVVADSCFSGALTRSVVSDLPESRTALLARLTSRRSRSVFTSGGLEPVLDSGIGQTRHSIFAHAFLQALQRNPDVIEAGRLFVRVRDSVSLNSDQTPQYAPLRNAGHDGGDFLFVRH